ncbi:microvitellogenin-like [Spodoptera frugiperda]|uniref:Microvitellogenin-like n=1 Tax=Spodoptera frugiperda TaxID=7108 RepID=A0A9R0DH64_SPOFR|nr:microvitellogenin-like [Spodoptera frugiperda]
MHSIGGWKLAQRPNYVTNTNKTYPYSECPYLGEYRLVKLPVSLNNLIEHVDYWGEGRIVTQQGNSGFSDCYNVNHVFQLVSNGPDRGRKIPNRIPVVNYTNCDTSAYIKDHSVQVVTVMGAPINNSCARDIARMINPDVGKVVAYGFERNSAEIRNLSTELKKKSMFHYPKYTLPSKLQGLTLFDSDMTFLNLTEIKDVLYNKVTEGSYDDAISLSKDMDTEAGSEAIGDVVIKLIRDKCGNVMTYAYKLWHSGATEIIHNSFPTPFQLILKGEVVTIVSKEYQQAMRLDASDPKTDTPVLGDSSDKISKKVSWKFQTEIENDNVVFKICNLEHNMLLKLDANTDSLGDRKVLASAPNSEVSYTYFVEPVMTNGHVVFRLIDSQYHQAVKMDDEEGANGHRTVWGHNGDPRGDNKSLDWVIAANTKLWEKEAIEI